MEKLKTLICPPVGHSCNAGIEPPKTALKMEIEIKAPARNVPDKTGQKPWSVFGDLYWI